MVKTQWYPCLCLSIFVFDLAYWLFLITKSVATPPFYVQFVIGMIFYSLIVWIYGRVMKEDYWANISLWGMIIQFILIVGWMPYVFAP